MWEALKALHIAKPTYQSTGLISLFLYLSVTLINSRHCGINIMSWFMLTLIILMGGVWAIVILGEFC